MPPVPGKRDGLAAAIELLERASIPVKQEAYGFSISHPDLHDAQREFGCCGCEHNYSISLSLFTDESPPVVWFFRFDYPEMAQFIVDAYASCTSYDRVQILDSMRLTDRSYDHVALESRIEEWCEAMSRQTGLDLRHR